MAQPGEVVADEDLENPNLQIALSEAQKIDASYEVGEEVTDEVNLRELRTTCHPEPASDVGL